jgi:hypothetical protein
VRLQRPLIVKRLKWHELWRRGSRGGRRFYTCEKRQSERPKMPGRQKKLRGKLKRLKKQRRLGGRSSRQLRQWRKRSRL